MSKVVLASNNPGKIEEFRELFSNTDCEVVAQGVLGIQSIEEIGLTFVENAILKARHATAESEFPAIADDSGLEVDALHGEPGVLSARYAETTEARNEKLLAALVGVPEEERTARYHSVIALLRHENDPNPLLCHGVWEGRIMTAPKGSGGFGYDPIFFVPTQNRSAAELSLEEKNKISHRGQAMRALLDHRHLMDYLDYNAFRD